MPYELWNSYYLNWKKFKPAVSKLCWLFLCLKTTIYTTQKHLKIQQFIGSRTSSFVGSFDALKTA